MYITLTFENGTTEKIGLSNYSMKMAKKEYMGAWRPNGIVVKVRKTK